MLQAAGQDNRLTIDLDAYKQNIGNIVRYVGSRTAVMAVVKGDAYGHGMLRCADAALHAGAGWLGVAHAWEAVTLREAGITAPVFVMAEEFPDSMPDMIRRGISFSVASPGMLEAAGRACADAGASCRIHIKVDTGMGRFGVSPDEAMSLFERAAFMPGVTVEGVFTHFSSADHDDETFSRGQIASFTALLARLDERGLRPPVVHMCNSPGTLKFPEAHFDLVRTGLMTYGLLPYPSSGDRLTLEPVMSWTARIAFIRDVPAGFSISYGGTFTTKRTSRLAVAPVGYADGYRRRLSNSGRALVNGVSVPIAGNICMDHTVFDITEAGEVRLEDTITLIGKNGVERITAEELAATVGTINYEITTGISGRVPKTYIETA